MREIKKIELFFLTAVLQIAMAGSLIILVADFLFAPQDFLSLLLDGIIFITCVISYALRSKYFTLAVLFLTGITLSAMFYQCLVVPINTSTSFAIILIVGFLFSILLKGWLQWLMHSIACVSIITVFIVQTFSPALRFSSSEGDIISIALTYLVLYGIISYCTAVLKNSYDHIQHYLRNANAELKEKTKEIAAQNEELLQAQGSLHELNTNLERMVHQRTEEIKAQNEILIKYTYTNAHHLRGPVTRLLGLVAIQRLEPASNTTFFFNKIEEQAKEIDSVVKKINSELQVKGNQMV